MNLPLEFCLAARNHPERLWQPTGVPVLSVLFELGLQEAGWGMFAHNSLPQGQANCCSTILALRCLLVEGAPPLIAFLGNSWHLNV